MEDPLVDDSFMLKKIPGKGGWTYTVLPENVRKQKTPFVWIQVRGFIDNYELKNYRLMPMKNGGLFLPVRAEVRKNIAKQEGDWVHVKLYADAGLIDVPRDFFLCLQDNEKAYSNFLKCTEAEQQDFIKFINSAKSEQAQIDRMAKSLDMLESDVKLPK